MSYRWILIAVALSLSSCSAPERDRPVTKVDPIVLTDDNFDEEVLQSKNPVLVDFWAPWCGPCKIIAPVVEELAGEFSGRLKVCKLDIDQAQATAARYDIQSIPTLIVFKNGRVRQRLTGLPQGDAKAALAAWLTEALD